MSAQTLEQRPRRVEIIDIGRGVAVVLMIMVHTMWLYADVETQAGSALGVALHVVGKGTAGFLVVMGFSFMVARDQSAMGAVRRGLVILGAGYLMNALKFVVPSLLGLLPDAFIEAYGWTPPPTAGQLVYMLLTGDILQLAGLCLILMGLIRKVTPNRHGLLVWAALFASGTHLLRGARIGVAGIDYLLDLLWGVEWNVYFPVFPWFAPILLGMFLGARYREHGDPDALMLDFLRFGVPMFAVGLVLVLLWPETHFVDFFHLGLGGILEATGAVLIVCPIIHYASRRREPGPLREFLIYSSERVTALYVLSWTVICWGMAVVGYQTLKPLGVVAAIPVVAAVSYGLCWLLDRAKASLRRPKAPAGARA